MSSSEARDRGGQGLADQLSRRSLLRAAVAVALVSPGLAACEGGFRPMYASTQFGGTNVDQKLAQVEVATVPGRVGQRIRNELIYQSTGGGERQASIYKLEIAIRENLTSTLVRSDGEAASQVYSIDAAFRLVDNRSKKIVLEGVSYNRAGFERFTSIFSNVRAREDAENRAAKAVGIDIKNRLATYLSTAT